MRLPCSELDDDSRLVFAAVEVSEVPTYRAEAHSAFSSHVLRKKRERENRRVEGLKEQRTPVRDKPSLF